jgi:hypothetical protein
LTDYSALKDRCELHTRKAFDKLAPRVEVVTRKPMSWRLAALAVALSVAGCDKLAKTEEPSGCATLPSDDHLLATAKMIDPRAVGIDGATCGEMLSPPGIGANVVVHEADGRQEIRFVYLQDTKKWVMSVQMVGQTLFYDIK